MPRAHTSGGGHRVRDRETLEHIQPARRAQGGIWSTEGAAKRPPRNCRGGPGCSHKTKSRPPSLQRPLAASREMYALDYNRAAAGVSSPKGNSDMPRRKKKPTNTPGEEVLGSLVGLLDALVCDSLERNIAKLPGFAGERTRPALLNRNKAAVYLDVSGGTIDKLRKAGEIKTVDIGGCPKYPRAELDRYIRKLKKER